jgi:hypothetical protein
MIPGATSKMTETTVPFTATIVAKSDILIVTGAGTIATILPQFGGGQFSGQLILVPTIAGVILGTTGNILVGITCVINRPVWLVYVKSLGKWLINSGV